MPLKERRTLHPLTDHDQNCLTFAQRICIISTLHPKFLFNLHNDEYEMKTWSFTFLILVVLIILRYISVCIYLNYVLLLRIIPNLLYLILWTRYYENKKCCRNKWSFVQPLSKKCPLSELSVCVGESVPFLILPKKVYNSRKLRYTDSSRWFDELVSHEASKFVAWSRSYCDIKLS